MRCLPPETGVFFMDKDLMVATTFYLVLIIMEAHNEYRLTPGMMEAMYFVYIIQL